jgi:DNA-binding CsgD family transcriptional regulator
MRARRPSAEDAGMALAGREDALRALDALLTQLPRQGGALLFRGARGLGRSALLEVARERAEAAGYAVLAASGTAGGTGLHELLRGLRADIEGPAPEHADAVDRLRIGVAVLEALASAAAERPLVVLIDDAHRLDERSRELLAFAGRRVVAAPIAFVVTAEGQALSDAQLPEVELRPLDSAAAREVLAPFALPERLADAVLAQAEGSPVALTELARAAHDRADALLAEPVLRLPVSPRLAGVLRSRVESLGDRTRALLLALALDPDATLDEAVAAAGADVTLADAGTALDAGTVEPHARGLRFTSPLTAAAAISAAGQARVGAVHAAFAAHLDDPRRRALHAAAGAVEPDDALAAAVSRAATALRRSGEPAAAAAAFEVAARLSESGPDKVRRLLSASLVALDLGLPPVVRRLLDEAERLGPPPRLAPVLEWQRRLLTGDWPVPDDAESARLIDALVAGPDADAALTALMPLAMGCWWSDPSPRIRAVMVESAARLARRTADPRADAIAALADPAAAGERVRARLAAPAPEDPLDAVQLAIAAQAVGAWHEAHRLIGPAVERLRRQGHAGALAHALIHEAHGAFYMGEWAVAVAVGREARELAARAGRPRQAFAGLLAHARALATIGDAGAALVEAEALAARSGLPGADAVLRSARASLALAAGDPERAAAELAPPFAAPVPQAMVRAGWEIFDLAEALVALDRHDEAAAHVRAFSPYGLGGLARAAVGCARTLVDHGAAVPDPAPWPFLRARMLLAHGGRERAADVLRAARDELAIVRAVHFVARAERELQTAGDAWTPAIAELTPHELRIARLAASGLSNPEIARRLEVSPRTIASHLYRVFPKLGVTSRAQLRSVLQEP